MSRFKKALKIIAALFLGYLLVGFFFINQILSQYIKTQLQAQTGITLEHQNIQFNPLRFVIQLHDLELKDSQGQEFLKADQLTANINPSHLLWGQFHLSEVALTAPEISIQLGDHGQTERPKLLPAENDHSDNNIDLLIDRIDIISLRLNLLTPFINQPIQLVNSEVQILGFNLSNHRATFELNLNTQQQEQLFITGTYQHANTTLSAQLNLNHFNSSSLNPWLETPWSLQLNKGLISGQAHVKWAAQQSPQISVDWLEAFELAGQWEQQLNFSNLFLRSEDIGINLNRQLINVNHLTVKQGAIAALLPWASTATSQSTPSDWQFELNHLTADAIELRVTDKNLSSTVHSTIEQFNLHQLNNDLMPKAFSLHLKQQEGGTLVIKSVTESNAINAQIMINAWPVLSLSPWLNQLTGLQFVQGKLQAAQSLFWQSNEWQSEGQLSFNQIHILDTQDRTLANLNQFKVGHLLVQSGPQKIYLDQISSDRAWGQLFSSAKETKSQYQDPSSTEWQVILGMPATNPARH